MRPEPSTPVRRLKHCRIMVAPWRVPTLIAYPPPPPDFARSRPMLELPRVRTPVPPSPSVPWEPRSAWRRRRDCVFIPDMDVAVQFLEARRRAAEGDRMHDPVPRLPPALSRRVASVLDTPLALGLLMMVLPPLAVTLVWSTGRLPRTAQIALTLYGALVTVALAAIAIAAVS